MKRKQVWLGLVISAAFLYLAFRKSDWVRIWATFKETDYSWVLASLPLMFIVFLLRALRWRYLLLPSGRPGLHSLFGAIMIGYMSLNLLPFRLGEFIRAYVLGRREAMSVSGVFATVVIERVLDGFTVLLLLVVTLFFLPFKLSDEVMGLVRAFSYLGLIIFLLALIFLITAKVKIGFIIRVIEVLLGRFPSLKDTAVRLIGSFAAGLAVLTDIRLFLISTVYSVLVWAATVASYWIIMFGFQSPEGINVGHQVGFLGSAFVLVAIALGIMIPSSPGFVGTFELASITALVALGVETSTAESLTIVAHAVQFIPVTLAGIVYLYLQNFSFREIRVGGQAAQAELKPPG